MHSSKFRWLLTPFQPGHYTTVNRPDSADRTVSLVGIKGHAVGLCRIDDSFNIHLGALATQQHARGQMADDVDGRVLDRSAEPVPSQRAGLIAVQLNRCPASP